MSTPAGPDRYAELGRILVIIPTYNEAENIELIVARVRTSVPEAWYSLPTTTLRRHRRAADKLAAADEYVHVLHCKGKEGLGAAYIAGFGWGMDNGYGVLVEMDADGSHQPEELPRLLDALGSADLVLGSRYVKGGAVRNWPKHREVLSRGGNSMPASRSAYRWPTPPAATVPSAARRWRGSGWTRSPSAGYRRPGPGGR